MNKNKLHSKVDFMYKNTVFNRATFCLFHGFFFSFLSKGGYPTQGGGYPGQGGYPPQGQGGFGGTPYGGYAPPPTSGDK